MAWCDLSMSLISHDIRMIPPRVSAISRGWCDRCYPSNPLILLNMVVRGVCSPHTPLDTAIAAVTWDGDAARGVPRLWPNSTMLEHHAPSLALRAEERQGLR